MQVLANPEALRALLAAHASAQGAEPCAALLGRVEDGKVTILEALPLANVHPAASRAFTVDPEALAAVTRDARARGLTVVGAWHGHLAGAAWLSRADASGLQAASATPGAGGAADVGPYVFLVSGRGAGRATVLRAFRLRRGVGAVEAPLRLAREA